MAQSTSQQSSSSSSVGPDVDIRNGPVIPERSRTNIWKTSEDRGKSTGSHKSSPRRFQAEDSPPLTKFSTRHSNDSALSKKRFSYDPYKPPDDFSEFGGKRGLADLSMSPNQVNRISRVLNDIEAQLTKMHYRINDSLEQNGGDEAEEALAYEYSYNYEQTSDDCKGYPDHDYPYDQSEMNSHDDHEQEFNPFEGDRRTFLSSSPSEASIKAFGYDDTEEIDQHLSKFGSQHELTSEDDLPAVAINHSDRNTKGNDKEDRSIPIPYQSTPRILDNRNEGGDTASSASLALAVNASYPSSRQQNLTMFRPSPSAGLPCLESPPQPTFTSQLALNANESRLESKGSVAFTVPNIAVHTNLKTARRSRTPLTPPPSYGLPSLPSALHSPPVLTTAIANDLGMYEPRSTSVTGHSSTGLYGQTSPKETTYSAEAGDAFPISLTSNPRPPSASSTGSSFDGSLFDSGKYGLDSVTEVSRLSGTLDARESDCRLRIIGSDQESEHTTPAIRQEQIEAFLHRTMPGLQMHDLKEFQQSLVASAMAREASEGALQNTFNQEQRTMAFPVSRMTISALGQNEDKSTAITEMPESVPEASHSSTKIMNSFPPDKNAISKEDKGGQDMGDSDLGSPLFSQQETGKASKDITEAHSRSSKSQVLGSMNNFNIVCLVSFRP